MSALSAMQEKNTHLENSLSAENRIKLDLFSALGEAKRQLEIKDSKLSSYLFQLFTIVAITFQLFAKTTTMLYYFSVAAVSS